MKFIEKEILLGWIRSYNTDDKEMNNETFEPRIINNHRVEAFWHSTNAYFNFSLSISWDGYKRWIADYKTALTTMKSEIGYGNIEDDYIEQMDHIESYIDGRWENEEEARHLDGEQN